VVVALVLVAIRSKSDDEAVADGLQVGATEALSGCIMAVGDFTMSLITKILWSN
jgi:hypothetical protein